MGLTLWATPSWSHAQIAFEKYDAGFSFISETNGASAGDFDGDGRPDLWISNHRKDPVLLVNRGDGTFVKLRHIHYPMRPKLDTHGAVWADVDGDGDQDLFQTVGARKGRGRGANVLFENDQGFLHDVGKRDGTRYAFARARSALWMDWNNDGALDLVISSKLRNDERAPTTVFLWEGLRFEPRVGWLDLVDGTHLAYGQLGDLTGDGRLNLLIAGDVPPHVSRGPGLSVFETGGRAPADVAPSLGLGELSARDSALADFDGDRRTDLLLIGFDGRIRLFVQRPRGFHEVVAPSFPVLGSGMSVTVGDFDHDMDLDAYVVRTTARHNLPNALLENRGAGRFEIVSDLGNAGGSARGCGDSVISGDWDGDGDLDLFVTNGRYVDCDPGPYQWFRNGNTTGHWIQIDLEGTQSNREGIGACVEVHTAGVVQVREMHGGAHRFSQDHSQLHFGLGPHAVIDRIVVRWPSGSVQRRSNVAAGQVLHLRES